MKLKDIYQRAVAVGIDNDPRGREAVLQDLRRAEMEFADLKSEEKPFFDVESLQNPYPDSRILFGDAETEVNSILVGIDIEVGELLLAESLKSRGEPVDLVMSHHPEGMAFANLYSVMHMQSDILNKVGVPINVAEDLMEGRVKEVERKLMPLNHTRAVDAAALLRLPFLCVHTPADNMVTSYLQRLFHESAPSTISDVLEILKNIAEYRNAMKNGSGPKILLGSKTRKTGKIFVDMTGGTEGAKDIFPSLTAAGVSTVVTMHLSEDHRKEAEKNHLNVVIAGHIPSDNLGINLLLDEVLKSSQVKILVCSGFHRIKRTPQ